jgi:hypothetical protein
MPPVLVKDIDRADELIQERKWLGADRYDEVWDGVYGMSSMPSLGGPDFLVEIESPGDDSEEKVPFYGRLGVRELLLIHRDKRALRLLRLEGQELVLVGASPLEGKRWLVSAVLPLAFRRKIQRGQPATEVRRTDRQPGLWNV